MIMIRNSKIDNGKAFDFGRTSYDYAKYRDIYPQIFYDKILGERTVRQRSDRVGFGYGYGSSAEKSLSMRCEIHRYRHIGNQIKQAVELTQKSNLSIEYIYSSAESVV